MLKTKKQLEKKINASLSILVISASVLGILLTTAWTHLLGSSWAVFSTVVTETMADHAVVLANSIKVRTRYDTDTYIW